MHNYIYVYLDPRKPGNFTYNDLTFKFEPFYVGKGKDSRYKRHLNKSQLSYGNNNIKKGKLKHIMEAGFNPLDYVIIVINGLNEEEAIKKEIEIIQSIGRITSKTGPLANLTDGGEGMSGNKSVLKGRTYEDIHGEEKAKQLKEDKKNRFIGDKNPMFGKESWCKGKHLSDETKRKLSESKSRPIHKICLKTGEILGTYKSAKEAAKEIGISHSGIHNCLSKTYHKTKSAGGYFWRYVDETV